MHVSIYKEFMEDQSYREREFESRTFQPFESALLSSQHLLLQLHSGYFEFLIHCDAGILQAGHFHEVAIARIATEIEQKLNEAELLR